VIIIINGVLGVGKTTVSWELSKRLERGVMLDIDHVGAVHPVQIHDPGWQDYVFRTVAHLVAFHRENGYGTFVANYVFEHSSSLDRFCAALRLAHEDEIRVFLLEAGLDVLDRRIRGRSSDSMEWELERARELVGVFEDHSASGPPGERIDVSDLTPLQVVELILERTLEPILMAPHDRGWPRAFRAEAKRIKSVLNGLACEIHQVGSTAVAGLPADPVIDILISLHSFEDLTAFIPRLVAIGYKFLDRPRAWERHLFEKHGPQSYNLLVVEEGSQSLTDHLAFRNALVGNAQLKRSFMVLKEALIVQFPRNRAAYSREKSTFIRGVLESLR